MNLLKLFKEMFAKKNKHEHNGTADITKGFYPELLFLVNKPYAQYVDFVEIK